MYVINNRVPIWKGVGLKVSAHTNSHKNIMNKQFNFIIQLLGSKPRPQLSIFIARYKMKLIEPTDKL